MDRRSGVFYREEELTVGREGACRTVTVGGGETCRDNRRSEETLQRSVKSRFQSDQLIVQPSSSQFLCFPWGWNCWGGLKATSADRVARGAGGAALPTGHSNISQGKSNSLSKNVRVQSDS